MTLIYTNSFISATNDTNFTNSCVLIGAPDNYQLRYAIYFATTWLGSVGIPFSTKMSSLTGLKNAIIYPVLVLIVVEGCQFELSRE